MNPLIETEKSLFIKCPYNERDKYFEGLVPKGMLSLSEEKEITVAGVSFYPKPFAESSSIEVGLSFGEGAHTLLRIDKGILKGLIGEFSATAVRRKYQIFDALHRVFMNCQKTAYPNWSLTIPPFHFNTSTSLIELKFVGHNTLVLFSNCLWDILAPQEGVDVIDRSSITFPEERSFSFFSNEPVLLSSTAYNEARQLFEDGSFSGFFPLHASVDTSIKCKSDPTLLEKYIKSEDDFPLYLCFLNFKSEKPFETSKFTPSTSLLRFNFLDLTDRANILVAKYVYEEISKFVQKSNIVQAYFGTLLSKNREKFSDESLMILPLIMHSTETNLAKLDLFLKFPDKNTLFYFSPNIQLKKNNGWISANEFNLLYGNARNDNNKEINIFPNVMPFPHNSSYFIQPFFLYSVNFGKYNFLSGQSGLFMGEQQDARCLLSMLKYSSKKGFEVCDAQCGEVSLGNTVKYLRIRMESSQGDLIPLGSKSYIVVRIYQV